MNLANENWTKIKYEQYQKYLLSLKEPKYQQFQQKIIKTKYEIIGIPVPIQRKIAQKIMTNSPLSFLKVCQNHYYEEINIKGFIIASLANEDYITDFLKEIDNWAICDSFCNSLKIKDKKQYLKTIKQYLKSSNEFTVRAGLVILLNFYVEEEYIKDIFKIVDKITRKEYYIQMAIAWLIAECFIKYPHLTWSYIINNNLDKFTQNKTISKIRDSYRVSRTIKERLTQYRK